ncbi:MAG: gliding motility-associated C-terminal domain-containing protein [Cytophaga sp.]|uniref:T9SS type B sorting domain-containing protein n=1 Tax=Cytophaga sp. TaxID=29535 RepID=UPI003F7D85D0
MSKTISRYITFLTFYIFLSHQSFATHIIGGELQVKWTGDGTIYQVTLNTYINEISVSKYGYGVETLQTVYFTTSVTPSNNNTYINQLDLPLVYNNQIATNDNFCATADVVRTNLLIYSKTVDLAQYLGSWSARTYYITWELCCRNEIITNLNAPDNQDIALYLQCPPLFYQNSAPIFKPLENEYFCKDVLSTYNMSATDPDGDRLVYSLSAPLQAIDPTYVTREVSWNSGYSGSNPIPGTVPLTINSSSGMLTFNPSQVGVYCFGILVQEYRGNVKIGEVKKDYQFNVQICPINNKPVIGFKDTSIKDEDTLTVKISEKKCFPVYITDIDASVYGITETIYVTAKTGKYPASAFNIPSQINLDGFRNTYNTNICFDPCNLLHISQTTYYPMSIIIKDNRCPAQYDTLIFTIRVEVDPNAKPDVFINPFVNPQVVKVDSLVTFGVFGTDADAGDLLSLTMYNRRDGMVFQDVRDSSQTISSPFSWRPSCSDLQPGTYTVEFIVKDNSCLLTNNADTVYQTIVVVNNEVSLEHMQVTNLITPNGDGLNDYYYIPGIPVGNCDTYFKGIEIYNRWGARIFYSQDRLFEWHPDVSDGVYYYSLDFNSELRKGWLQVLGDPAK